MRLFKASLEGLNSEVLVLTYWECSVKSLPLCFYGYKTTNFAEVM